MAEIIDVTPNKDGGVMKEILTPGTGADYPSNGAKVTAHYHGTLTDGTVFDSSVQRNQPFEFQLGVGSVIKAWDIGVATMLKGEKARFTCKSDYAYGASGSPPKIPGGATLIFEITLLSWKDEDLSPNNDGGVQRSILEKGDGFANPEEFSICKVHLKGSHDSRVFEDREVTFPVGEGSEIGVPTGIEISLLKMLKGEKSRITLLPKYHWPNGNEALGIPPEATIKYEVTLKEFEKKESWDMDAADKIAEAKLLKERATEYLKNDKLLLAINLFKKAASYIDTTNGFTEIEDEERKKLYLATLLNQSLAYLKTKEPYQAKEALNKVLEVDPANVKAYYRRGQALLAMSEPAIALNDFSKVLELEPENNAAKAHVNECKRKIQAERQKERQIYSNMFDKFAKADREGNYRFGWWDDRQKQPVVSEIEPEEKEDAEERRLERKKQLEHLKKVAEEKKRQLEEEARKRLEAGDQKVEEKEAGDKVEEKEQGDAGEQKEDQKSLGTQHEDDSAATSRKSDRLRP